MKASPAPLNTAILWVASACFWAGCGKAPEQEPRGEQEVAKTATAPPAPEPAPTIGAAPGAAWDQIDDPASDGWDSEVLAKRAKDQLGRLGALCFGDDGGLAQLLAPGFEATQLVPATLEVVYDDGAVKVERGTGSGDYGQTLAAELEAIRAAASDGRAEFKVTAVTRGGAEDSFVTGQRVSLAFRGAGDTAVEHHAAWEVDWRGAGDAPKIARIRVLEFERSTTAAPVFADVAGSVLSANDCYGTQLSRGMNHWLARMPVRAMLNRFGTPGLAVGDVDGDGLDDLYLCQEPGLPNRLFLQNPDGSARDASAAWGVDWIEDSRSALLLDFDNDGDQDLAVAIHGAVVIARNTGQRFEVAAVLPAAGSTASLAAADYDADGLPDLFVCAYARSDSGLSIGAAAERFVYHDAENGAANSLYHNGGDLAFSDATAGSGVDANNRRWSFAAGWEDFDLDGDPDLYVANDYGPNKLFRNDGGGRFTDVAADAGAEDSASGMSVSWGDYDRDGRADLYVSNMFSAAGSRVTGQGEFRPGAGEALRGKFQRFARGNTLLRRAGDGFEDTSVSAGVTLGRWAWGSNFADLNNDSWPDLVVANGYLSSDGDTGDL